MHKLAQLIAERISNGLQRKAVTNCAVWAEKYRVMGAPFPGPWKWVHHPWLYEMHIAEGERLIGQKSAQMGYTQWALNKTFYAMDILGLSVLYILPSNDEASDFSADRFDKALENSEYLSKFFSDVKNVGHKRAGNSSLYVRGSKSRSKLKSVDTALIIFDEMDEMNQDNLSLALERQSGQRIETQQVLALSTPTLEDVGINAQFKRSTQEHYMFKCPSCKKFIEFKFPESIVITAESVLDPRIKDTHYICYHCQVRLEHEAKPEFLRGKHFGGTAEYIPTHADREWRGFYVNQMYSYTIAPSKLAESYLLGLNDPTFETEFYNSKMGLPHAVAGSKVTEDDINKCRGDYRKGPMEKKGPRTIGIDVGKVCHISIEEWDLLPHVPGRPLNDEAEPYLLWEGTTSGGAEDFAELDRLIYEWSIDGGVIDAEPERRIALQFATRHWGKILLCDFLWSQQGRQAVFGPEEECTVKVNRTSWLDLALGRFKTKTIHLPHDVSAQYRAHVQEPQRVYKKDKWGNPFGHYESKTADHFAFSRVYSEIALGIAIGRGNNTDIKTLY